MIGVGIIGAGNIFRTHAGAYDYLQERMRLIAVADTDPAKRDFAAGRYFIPAAFDDYRRILDRDDVDVVDICSPPKLHEKMVIDALEAGKYVLCEKPLAPSLAALDNIQAAAARFPGKLSTIHQLRYDPDFRKLLWLKDRGYLGDLFLCHALRLDNIRQSAAYRSGWWGKWDVAGGGVAMTQFIHHIDQVCCLLGRPVEVRAIAECHSANIESEDTFSAAVRFAGGAQASFCATVGAQRPRFQLDVVGQHGTAHLPWSWQCDDKSLKHKVDVELSAVFPQVANSRVREFASRAICKIRRKMGQVAVYRPMNVSNLHAFYLEDVCNAIDEQRPLPVGLDEVRHSLEVCLGIYAATLSGHSISLPLERSLEVYHGATRAIFEKRHEHANTPTTAPG